MNGRYIICKSRILDFRPRVLEKEKLKLERERVCRVTKGRERRRPEREREQELLEQCCKKTGSFERFLSPSNQQQLFQITFHSMLCLLSLSLQLSLTSPFNLNQTRSGKTQKITGQLILKDVYFMTKG